MKQRTACAWVCTLALVGLSAAASASAHEAKAHQHAAHGVAVTQTDWGIAGKDKNKARAVHIEIDKNFRFVPSSLAVKRGETLRLIVTNRTAISHEFVLGTLQENQRHAEAMLKNPNMIHDEPHQASVEPGATKEVVWTFNRAGEFEFACMVPGHYLLGMRGKIDVTRTR